MSVLSRLFLGSAVSVFDFLQVDSALSPWSGVRQGNRCCAFGRPTLGAPSMSVLGHCTLGSFMCCRGLLRCGSLLSVLDACCCGAALSLRAVTRLGSTSQLGGKACALVQIFPASTTSTSDAVFAYACTSASCRVSQPVAGFCGSFVSCPAGPRRASEA
jgi:hypothetical protein